MEKLYLVISEEWFGGSIWCRNVDDPITRCDRCRAELFDVRIFLDVKGAESHIEKFNKMIYDQCVFHGKCVPEMIIVELEKPIEDKIYMVVSENPFGGHMDHPCSVCGERMDIKVFGSDTEARKCIDDVYGCSECSREFIVREWQL